MLPVSSLRSDFSILDRASAVFCFSASTCVSQSLYAVVRRYARPATISLHPKAITNVKPSILPHSRNSCAKDRKKPNGWYRLCLRKLKDLQARWRELDADRSAAAEERTRMLGQESS